RIQSGTNVLQLAKRNDLWRVAERSDYPADFSKISDLMLKLADLKVVQSEQIGPSQLGRFELLPPGPATNSGTLVEFKNDSGKTLDTLLLGKQHMQKSPANSQFGGMGDGGWPDGRYVMVGTNSGSAAVISDPLEDVQPQPAQWLNKEFLSVQKPSSIEVNFPETTNSWKLTRASETNDWQLADAKAGETLDSTKISSVTSPFSSVRFDDVSPIKGNDSTNATDLTVTTFDGFTYVARIGQKQGDNYPVTFQISAKLPTKRVAAKDEKPDEKAKLDKAFEAEKARLTEKLAKESKLTNWVYQLPAYSVEEILKPRHELLVEPKKEAKPTTTASKK
ncbi:MAG TPA: DUF4340 domain-containing protein, partial [Candidatus Binatia bacterium]|nr:DUF4340 domain-containing protein [Candidatus Binatia bacterium]